MELKAYAKNRQSKILKTYIEKASAATDRRPQLAALWDEARKKKFDVVLVWRFDRFARSIEELLLALEEFNHLEIDFISFRENVDTGSPTSKA